MERRAVEVTSVFAHDIAFEPVDDQRFLATVTDHWNGLHGRPLGGYALAVALQPLRSQMPFPDLLVSSAFFLRPVMTGPVEVRTEIVRIGRRTATGETRLFQNGKEAIRSTATFTNLPDHDDAGLAFAQPPALPRPEDSIDLHSGEPLPPSSVANRLEYRVGETPGWRRGQPSGDPLTELWLRLVEGGGEDTLTVPFLVDAAAPAVMDIGAAGSTSIELTVYVRSRPTPGWNACRASTRLVKDGYHEEDFELWDDNHRLIAQARQLAIVHMGPAIGTLRSGQPT
jgi:acyl-CoA thioesterase